MDIEEELENFLDNEKRTEGNKIEAEIPIYPAEKLDWHDSEYLKVDENGENYMVIKGELIYKGINNEQRHQYLLKGKVGNFKLLRENDRLLIVDYFRPRGGGVYDNESRFS